MNSQAQLVTFVHEGFTWYLRHFNSAAERLAWLASRYHNDDTPDVETKYLEHQLRGWNNTAHDKGEGVYGNTFWAWTTRALGDDNMDTSSENESEDSDPGDDSARQEVANESDGSKDGATEHLDYDEGFNANFYGGNAQQEEREYPKWDGNTDDFPSEEAFRAALDGAEAEDDRLDALVDSGYFEAPAYQRTTAPSSEHEPEDGFDDDEEKEKEKEEEVEEREVEEREVEEGEVDLDYDNDSDSDSDAGAIVYPRLLGASDSEPHVARHPFDSVNHLGD